MQQAVDHRQAIGIEHDAGVGVPVTGLRRDPASTVGQLDETRVPSAGMAAPYRRSTIPACRSPSHSCPSTNSTISLNAFDAERPYRVESVERGGLVLSLDGQAAWLRPGNTVAGPVFMMLADAAAYAVVLAHIGASRWRSTSNLDINFLRKTERAQITAAGSVSSSVAAWPSSTCA